MVKARGNLEGAGALNEDANRFDHQRGRDAFAMKGLLNGELGDLCLARPGALCIPDRGIGAGR